MLATTATFTRKHYAFLGKLLLLKEPETAQKLIKTYLPEQKPQEEDFSKIESLFQQFCNLRDISTASFSKPTVSTRRLFVSVILHLYNPQVYFQPSDQIILKYGFVRAISQVLKQKESNVSTMIREVICWERSYEEFAQEVSVVIQKLTNAGKEEK